MPEVLVPEDRTLKVQKFRCLLDNDPNGVLTEQTFEVRDTFTYSRWNEGFQRLVVPEARVRRVLMQENCFHVDGGTYRVDMVLHQGSRTEETDFTEERLLFLEAVTADLPEFLRPETETITKTKPVYKVKMGARSIKKQLYSME